MRVRGPQPEMVWLSGVHDLSHRNENMKPSVALTGRANSTPNQGILGVYTRNLYYGFG